MTDKKRRRLLQAALAAPVALRWSSAGAQAERNLGVTERAAPAPAGGPAAGSLLVARRRALVIGNSAYGFSPLKNPANDARAISAALKATGFDVTAALDFTRTQMLEAIAAYSQALARDKAIGLFYFAGHGVQLAWRNYLLPTDAKVERIEQIQASCVDVNSVIDGIAKAQNPMNVVILDACRENPFGSDFRVEQKGLSQLDAPPGTLLAYATSPGNVASDGAGENGLYTENLLKEIRTPEAKIEDVFKRVRLAVRRRSNGQQIPWESTSLEEDFWFIPPRELKRRAEEEMEREFQRQHALWEKVQAAERERRAQAERERLRREEAVRLEQARLAELRRLEEAERERLRREGAAAAEKLKAAERARREAEERERRARAEAQRVQREALAVPLPIEEYLRAYPSGYFSELAQLELDRALEGQGERKIEVVSSAQNPYSQGSARADTRYRVGDRYEYNVTDLTTRQLVRVARPRITQITGQEVIFNKGGMVTDLLGNLVRQGNRRFSPNQIQPGEFAVGRRWSTRYTVTNEQGREHVTEMSLRIVRRERITVPAGTFDTFRVEADVSTNALTGNSVSEVKFWYAPDKLRRFVAREETRVAVGDVRRRGGRVLLAERMELVSFQQA
jgi:uncharacterized caspase-like protein